MTENSDKLSFEQALQQLEGIVRRLEEGDIGLAEALSHYEDGVSCLRACYDLLEQAERRIELLTGVDGQGRAVTEAFDQQASFSPDGEADRPARRKAGRKQPPPVADGDGTDMDESGRLF